MSAAATYKPAAKTVVIVSTLVTLLAVGLDAWAFVAAAAASIALISWAVQRDRAKSKLAIAYNLDPATSRAFESLSNGVGWLASSKGLWKITREEPARSPGTNSIRRTSAVVRTGANAWIVTNLRIPELCTAGESLLFFPDAVYVAGYSSTVTAVPYTDVQFRTDTVQFSEPDVPPSDAKQVGVTWLYANKNGSPDRRRTGNRQIPQFEYARVTLTTHQAEWPLLVSNSGAARHFASSFLAMTSCGVAESLEPNVGVPAVERPQTSRRELDASSRLPVQGHRSAAEVNLKVAPRPVDTSSTHGSTGSAAEWLSGGRSAMVHGLSTGDFVYIGRGLATLDASGFEPSLIDPALPVDPEANITGEGVTYWPSYSGISPSSRRAFLQWLGGGRTDPNMYIGYVFIFFYGLERRVYEFVRGLGSSSEEIVAIATEVVRLLDLYGDKSGSFDGYAAGLIDFLLALEPRVRTVAWRGRRRQYGPSTHLKIALGELSVAGRPVPAALALDWVRSTAPLGRPAARCPQEFELLFHVRYANAFGEGLVIEPNKQFVDLSYRPASAGLRPLTVSDRRVPDVTQLTRPAEKFVEIARSCSGSLEPFSRYLGKNPNGRNSLAATALLPDELIEGIPSADATSLGSLVSSRLNENGRADLAAAELLTFARLSRADRVTRAEAMQLTQALEKLGYGIEPDVRLGGPPFQVDGRVVVFRRLPDCPSAASEEYSTAALMMRLAAVVSTVDGISAAEREVLQAHIEQRLTLTAGERQRLDAHLAWLLESGPAMTGLKKRLEGIPNEKRDAIARLLIEVAAADGHVDPREIKALEKIYDLLELSRADLYRNVHALQGSDEPVAVVEASPAKAYAIPSQAVRSVSGLDMDRVRLTIAQTRQVSTLLSNIFVDEASTQATPTVFHASVDSNTIGSLDAAHSELFRRLIGRPTWSRDDVESIAGELSLMTDGALETLNDFAYATVDEPLWEDDDPIVINATVARELIL